MNTRCIRCPSAGISPVRATAGPVCVTAASPSWPWLRAALVLAGAAQLITISAVYSADPLAVSWPAPLLAIAPAPLAAFAVAPVGRLATVFCAAV